MIQLTENLYFDNEKPLDEQSSEVIALIRQTLCGTPDSEVKEEEGIYSRIISRSFLLGDAKITETNFYTHPLTHRANHAVYNYTLTVSQNGDI